MDEAQLVSRFDGQHHLDEANTSAFFNKRIPGKMTYFGNVESGEFLVEGVSLDKQVEQIASAFVIENLVARLISIHISAVAEESLTKYSLSRS